MKLRIRRIACKPTYTIGKLEVLTVDGWVWVSDTLEDPVRDYNKDGDLEDEGEEKIYGDTAIPYGTYEIDMNSISPKFSSRVWASKYGGIVPLIKNVKHFSGCRFHPANYASQLAGCIAVGRNTEKGKVNNSQYMYFLLMDNYFMPAKRRGEKITLEII